ncbi:sodium-dependent bicarbonate transport family permease [Spartinivicinus poritis]|uniref:Sodium-dependent bicarbonate transport family permease n=1 Tax=Spartinivicinus poritis TaxID=2994640 RepID=A0ABT5U498_9GAMM|nr:sodium-dependent bicarbonate transport family permease [Spartinivicinus sp. A2-2]MDE1460801.1 sodium-dependent bicarbonate transport family permease [Spartinivicinus sp. A2-2]
MQLDVGIAFFILGVFATLVRSNIQFPKGLYQSLILFLMIAIGLKGGVALAEHASWQLVSQSISVILFGLLLPLIAFPILYYIGELKRYDAASIAAHYGSVSVGTYAVAVAFLEAQNVAYEPYLPLFVVLLEMPAIAVGIVLARHKKSAAGGANDSESPSTRVLLHEMLFNQGMLLMVGGLLIGFMAGERVERVTPFFFELFNGVLALFLLQMGMTAASRLGEIKRLGNFMLAFGVAMPLVGGVLGCLLGLAIGLSTGGTVLLAVLGASASYIAVPAAMHVALPQANQSLSISASLGITFPFNVLIGIPTFMVITQWITG